MLEYLSTCFCWLILPIFKLEPNLISEYQTISNILKHIKPYGGWFQNPAPVENSGKHPIIYRLSTILLVVFRISQPFFLWVFLWFSSGFPLVSYGFPLVFLWFPMVFLWFPMVFLWFSYGFLWFAYGFLGVSEQPHLGFCNEQRLCFGQILWVISTAFDASLRTRRSSLSWRKRLRTVGIFPDFSGLGYLGYLNDPQFMTSF